MCCMARRISPGGYVVFFLLRKGMKRMSDSGLRADAAVGQCSGLPRPGGVGHNWIGHVAAIVSIMRDQMHCLFWTDNGFVDEWDSSSGKPWLASYLDGTKGRSTTLPARHGW